ncbi:unnamed protein product, partial [Mesorhabditis spiculigera]
MMLIKFFQALRMAKDGMEKPANPGLLAEDEPSPSTSAKSPEGPEEPVGGAGVALVSNCQLSPICTVCQKAPGRNNYGGICCSSCKIFFLRAATKGFEPVCRQLSKCQFIMNKCKGCRYARCLEVGMVPEMTGRREGCNRRTRAEVKLSRQGRTVNWRKGQARDHREISEESSVNSISPSLTLDRPLSMSPPLEKMVQSLMTLERYCLHEEDEQLSQEHIFNLEYNLDLQFVDVLTRQAPVCSRVPVGFANAKHMELRPTDILLRGIARLVLYMVDWFRATRQIWEISEESRTRFCASRVHILFPLIVAYYTYKYSYSECVCGLGYLFNLAECDPASNNTVFLSRMQEMIFEHIVEVFRELEFTEEEFVVLKNIVIFCNPITLNVSDADAQTIRQARQFYENMMVNLCRSQGSDPAQVRARVVRILELCQVLTNMGGFSKAFLTRKLLDDAPTFLSRLVAELHAHALQHSRAPSPILEVDDEASSVESVVAAPPQDPFPVQASSDTTDSKGLAAVASTSQDLPTSEPKSVESDSENQHHPAAARRSSFLGPRGLIARQISFGSPETGRRSRLTSETADDEKPPLSAPATMQNKLQFLGQHGGSFDDDQKAVEQYYENNHYSQVAGYVKKLDETLTVIANEIFVTIQQNATSFSEDSYIQLLQAEERFSGSAFEKANDESKMLWNYWSATFYSTNIFMTVGYGVIAPLTDLGRVITVIYAVIFIPISSVVCRDLGQWMLVGLTKLYARLLIRWRTARGVDTREDEDIVLPMKFAGLTAVVYWFFCALLTWYYDDIMGEPGTGMTYWASVYFSFITLTSVGLGDLMPNNVTRSPLQKVWYFLGLPVFKVVNRMTYVSLENGVFGTLTVLENKLEMWNQDDKVVPKFDRGMSNGASLPQTTLTGFPSDSENTVTSGKVRRRDSLRSRATVEEQEALNEHLNNFTVKSIKQFMQSRGDVYGGDFGRVKVTKAQLDSLKDDPKV